jgi:hypothetical protein
VPEKVQSHNPEHVGGDARKTKHSHNWKHKLQMELPKSKSNVLLVLNSKANRSPPETSISKTEKGTQVENSKLLVRDPLTI